LGKKRRKGRIETFGRKHAGVIAVLSLLTGIIPVAVFWNIIFPAPPTTINYITINIYNPDPRQPLPTPNLPVLMIPEPPLEIGFHVSQLTKGEDNRFRFDIIAILKNTKTYTLTLNWAYLIVTDVTYVDGSSERWRVSGNSTINQSIRPNEYSFLRFGISEYGFEKTPRSVTAEVQMALSDPDGVRHRVTIPLPVKFQ
jgi:hypothetical protein